MTKKKGVHKKTARKKTSRKTHSAPAHHVSEHRTKAHHESDIHIEKVLVENFVALQKVMTNLSLKFDNLSTQISKLLELFEISAKTMAQKDFDFGAKDNKEMMKKIDNLLEQNKVIARGLTLLHEPGSSQNPMQMNQPPQQISPPRPLPPSMPRMPMQNISQKTIEEPSSGINMNEYQKSQHIDESSSLTFDIGRGKKEEKSSAFGV